MGRLIILTLILLTTTIVVVCSSAYRFHSRIRVKDKESCTSDWFCALGRGLPSPKIENHLWVQDSSSSHSQKEEHISPTMKKEKCTSDVLLIFPSSQPVCTLFRGNLHIGIEVPHAHRISYMYDIHLICFQVIVGNLRNFQLLCYILIWIYVMAPECSLHITHVYENDVEYVSALVSNCNAHFNDEFDKWIDLDTQ